MSRNSEIAAKSLQNKVAIKSRNLGKVEITVRNNLFQCEKKLPLICPLINFINNFSLPVINDILHLWDATFVHFAVSQGQCLAASAACV